MNTAGIDSTRQHGAGNPATTPAGVTSALAHENRNSPNLDLLLHLLANLPQAIMLVGPEGAGKTSTLRHLQAQAHDSWTICYVSCSANLTFRHLLNEIIPLFRKPGRDASEMETESFLEEQLSAFPLQDRTLVLLLDDAGVLMPGLLATICQFVRQHPAMRLAFAVRPEDLAVIATTDALAIRHARAVHLPSPPQQSEALNRRVASSPEPMRPEPKTLGLVGGLTVASPTEQDLSRGGPLWLLFGTLVTLLAAFAFLGDTGDHVPASMPAAGSTQTPEILPEPPLPAVPENSVQPGPTEPPELPAIDSREATTMQLEQSPLADQPAPTLIPPEPVATPIVQETDASPASSLPPAEKADQTPGEARTRSTEAALPVATSPQLEPVKKPADKVESAAPTRTNKRQTTQSDKNARTDRETRKGIEKKAPKPAEKPKRPPLTKPSGNVISGVNDAHWLMRQNPASFTLQLIAVSQFDALAGFIQQVPASDALSSFRSQRDSGDLYPLFYGIYPNLGAAKDAANRLPSSLGKPFPRQLRSVQQEILRMTPSHTNSITPSQ